MLLHAFYAISCALVWAGTNIAGKLLPSELSALTFAFIRYTIAVLCFLPFLQASEYKNITRRMVPSLIFLGLTAVFIYNIFFYNALHLASVTSVSLLSVTNPIMTLIGSAIIARRIPTKYQLIAVMLSFAGAAMIITQGKTGLDVFSGSLGELLALAAVISYVCYTLMLKKISPHFSPVFLSFATSVSGLLLLAPFVINYDLITTLTTLTRYEWGLFMYLGCIGTALGLMLYTLSIRRRGAELTSLITFSTMPFFVCILSAFIFGEQMSVWQMTGGAFVLAGLFVGVKKG